MYARSITASSQAVALARTKSKVASMIPTTLELVSSSSIVMFIDSSSLRLPPTAWSYCQKDVAGQAIFLKGPSTFANMDIDCDGIQKGGDGRCGSSTDTQSQTAFEGQIPGNVIKDLNANIHPYVVFGNYGDYSPTFDPEAHGIKPLSVMAVVCGDKLVSNWS